MTSTPRSIRHPPGNRAAHPALRPQPSGFAHHFAEVGLRTGFFATRSWRMRSPRINFSSMLCPGPRHGRRGLRCANFLLFEIELPRLEYHCRRCRRRHGEQARSTKVTRNHCPADLPARNRLVATTCIWHSSISRASVPHASQSVARRATASLRSTCRLIVPA